MNLIIQDENQNNEAEVLEEEEGPDGGRRWSVLHYQ